MGLLDKVKQLFGGAAKTTGTLAEKAGETAKDAFEKVEDVAESAVDQIRGKEESSGEATPGGPPTEPRP
jgi:hypothetical protein